MSNLLIAVLALLLLTGLTGVILGWLLTKLSWSIVTAYENDTGIKENVQFEPHFRKSESRNGKRTHDKNNPTTASEIKLDAGDDEQDFNLVRMDMNREIEKEFADLFSEDTERDKVVPFGLSINNAFNKGQRSGREQPATQESQVIEKLLKHVERLEDRIAQIEGESPFQSTSRSTSR